MILIFAYESLTWEYIASWLRVHSGVQKYVCFKSETRGEWERTHMKREHSCFFCIRPCWVMLQCDTKVSLRRRSRHPHCSWYLQKYKEMLLFFAIRLHKPIELNNDRYVIWRPAFYKHKGLTSSKHYALTEWNSKFIWGSIFGPATIALYIRGEKGAHFEALKQTTSIRACDLVPSVQRVYIVQLRKRDTTDRAKLN